MKIYIFMCLLCTVPAVTTAILANLKNDDNVKNLTDCLINFVQNWAKDYNYYFKEIQDITAINVKDEIDLSAIHEMEHTRIISRSFFAYSETMYNAAYIIISEDYEELYSGLYQITSDVFWKPTASFIIIIRNLGKYSLNKIHKLLREHNMYKITLIINKNYDYAVFMYNLTSTTCVKDEQLAFVSWCSNYTGDIRLLPIAGKLSIRKCRFKLQSYNLWPYANFDETGKEGLEQYKIKLFEKYASVKIKFELYEKVDRFGNVPKNMTQDLFDKVENNEVDGFPGGYPIGILLQGNLSFTYPLSIEYMLYTFAHTKVLGQWEAVLSRCVPLCVMVNVFFVVFSGAAILLSIFSKRQKNALRDILLVLGYILGTSCTKNIHSGLPQRIVFINLLILSLMLPYILQAYLYSVTYHPVRGFEPKKIEEAKSYTPVFFTEMYHDYRSTAQDCGSRMECLFKVKNCPDKSLYTVLSESVFNIHSWMITDDQCKLQLYTLKQPFSTLFRTIYLRRGSILLEHYDDFLFRIVSAGLQDKYLSDIYYAEWMKCKTVYQNLHKPISLLDIYGACYVLLFGYILSSIIWICELFLGACNSKQIRLVA